MNKLNNIKQIVSVYSFIFIVWALYRFLFRLPLEIEEIILKPLIWLVPVLWITRKQKDGLVSLGWSGKNLFKSLYLGIGLGIVFAIEGFIANGLKYGASNFAQLPYKTIDLMVVALLISLITAISEETVFRGFIFSRLSTVFKNEWLANIISSVGWTLIHLPVAIFVLHYSLEQIIIYLFLIFVFGFASCLVYGRTGTITASILLHVFWSWPINLFR